MNKIRVTKHVFKSNNKSFSAIVVGDVHYSVKNNIKDLMMLNKKIKELNPDYVFFVGDFIDYLEIFLDMKEQQNIINFFKSISEGRKVICSYGNHEFYSNKSKYNNNKLISKKLNQIPNIYYLDNDTYEDDLIYVLGITLTREYFTKVFKKENTNELVVQLLELKEKVHKLPKNKTKFMLVHSPSWNNNDRVVQQLQEFDYIFSGHYHAGLMLPFLENIVPKNCGLIQPNKILFPKIARGVVDLGHPKLLITSGFTKLSCHYGVIINSLNGLFYRDIDYFECK